MDNPPYIKNVICLWGIQNIGKTAFASYIYHDPKLNQNRGIFWVNGDELKNDKYLSHFLKSFKGSWFQKKDLLIIDNFTGSEDFLKEVLGEIDEGFFLITSQKPLSNCFNIKIDFWKSIDAEKYWIQRKKYNNVSITESQIKILSKHLYKVPGNLERFSKFFNSEIFDFKLSLNIAKEWEKNLK